jgi:putative transposase
MEEHRNARLEPGAPRWHSRGYIPHFESEGAIQHVTYHLADSLPADILARFEDELRTIPPHRRDVERRKRIQVWIDAGHGCCVLREPAVANMIQSSFLHFDGERYRLYAWVVMPNHVHVLFQPLAGWTMAKIVASWKSFTGRRIAAYMDRVGWVDWEGQAGAWRAQGGGRIWQREYWDRFIRNERHFWTAVAYIHNNPVKAGLVERAEDWPWSSASAGARLEPGVPIGPGCGIATLQRGPDAGKMIQVTEFDRRLATSLPDTFALLRSANLTVHPRVTRIVLHGSRGPAGGDRPDSDLDMSLTMEAAPGTPRPALACLLQDVLATTLSNWRNPVKLDLAAVFDTRSCGLGCFDRSGWDEEICAQGGVDCFGLYKIGDGNAGRFIDTGVQVKQMYPCLKIWERGN